MEAFLGFLVFLALMGLYFLPAILYLDRSGDGFFGNLLFFCICLLVNWTIIGWIMTMAMADAEKG